MLALRLDEILDAVDATKVVLVWERLGAREFGREELCWAGSMADACRVAGVRLRAQFVLHDGGVRQLAPDDYVGYISGNGCADGE